MFCLFRATFASTVIGEQYLFTFVCVSTTSADYLYVFISVLQVGYWIFIILAAARTIKLTIGKIN